MYDQKAPKSIAALFDVVAAKYDKTNAYMSLGLHKYWNQVLARTLAENKPSQFVDLCGGTGAITLALQKITPFDHGHIIDFSEGMLNIAQNKLDALNYDHIKTLQSDITKIDLPSESFDAAAIAYGIRNVKDRLAALKEAHRLLKPQGMLAILELTRPRLSLLRGLHRLYLKRCIPLVGALSTKNRDAYAYLSSSIEQFIDTSQLESEIKKAGFEEVKTRSLLFGCATLFIAKR